MMSQWGLHLFFVTEVARHAQGSDDVPTANRLALAGCIKDASGLNDVHVDTFSVLQSVMSQLPFP